MPLTRKKQEPPVEPPKLKPRADRIPPGKRPAPAVSPLAEIIETKLFPTRSLQTYYHNPRIGDIGLIAESLEENGQYKALTVNIGTKTGRRNEVLGGNHTLLAARHLGWKNIWASFVDVDEDRAARIVLADNATADKGTYDPAELSKLMASLPTITGTGYIQEEVDALLATTKQIIDDSADMLEEYENKVVEDRKRGTFDGALLGEEPDPDDDEEANSVPGITETEDRLPGLQSLKTASEVRFDGVGPWDIPTLRNDMLVRWRDVPRNLKAWAGSATRNDDQTGQWWLYNWAIDSTSGMEDISHAIPAFFCYDHYFAKWWDYPERYAGKLLNSGISMMISHDFTPGGQQDPRMEALYAVYKNRWLARYMQEAGIRVIPNIGWRDGDEDFLRNTVLATLPVGLPSIAIQLQTLDDEKVSGGVETYLKHIQLVFDTLKPKGAILYVGKQVLTMIESGKLTFPCETIIVKARMFALGEQAKGRQRKSTI